MLPDELPERDASSCIVVVVEPPEPREYRLDSEGYIIAVPLASVADGVYSDCGIFGLVREVECNWLD